MYKALGINVFGGGFTMGVRAAGFEVKAQWEECDAGKRTFDMNPKYFGGIHRPLRYEDWDFLGQPRYDLVYANPPCAPWSAANTRAGMTADMRRADPRLAMTARTMESAMVLEPRTFALESVARAYTMGRAYYDGWAQRWIDMGYEVTYYLTDALLHGVPSTRQRFHFIAAQRAVHVEEPDMKRFMPKTVSGAIGDIMDSFGQLSHHMPRRESPQAHHLMGVVAQGRLLNGMDQRDDDVVQRAVEQCTFKPSFLNRRLVWDAPGFTMVNLTQHVHPLRARRLTQREGLRLCGYPDDFVVAQSEGATQAVMPLAGMHVANVVRAALDRNNPSRRDLFVVDERDIAKPYRPGSVRDEMEENNE